MSGTSMASPHVAGIVALLMSQSDRQYNPSNVKRILMALATNGTVSKLPAKTPNAIAFNNIGAPPPVDPSSAKLLKPQVLSILVVSAFCFFV
jgi:subtilisin family serine protease